MLLTKLQMMAACCLVVCGLAVGASLPILNARAAEGPPYTQVPEATLGEGPQLTNRKPANEKPVTAVDNETIQGSGNVIRKELPLAGFTTLNVNPMFEVEVSQAPVFHVTVAADDNLMPHVQAVLNGAALQLAIDPQVKRLSAVTLRATIAMPALESLRLASGSRATVKGFKSDKPFRAFAAFSSSLEGEIDALKVALDLAGGSQVTLKGTARELKVSASQACRLSLADLVVDRAQVTLKDGSTASVNVKDTLDYDLCRASRLNYRNNPVSATGKATEGSRAVVVP